MWCPGSVWYLFVLTPDFCLLPYFVNRHITRYFVPKLARALKMNIDRLSHFSIKGQFIWSAVYKVCASIEQLLVLVRYYPKISSV